MKIIKSQRGFTLIEILIVIAIIAILFIMLLPQIDASVNRARESGVKTDFRSFQTASEMLLRETTGKSVSLDLLNTYLDKGHEIYDDGTNKFTRSEDPWGNAYVVGINEGKVVFYSHGKEEDTSTKKYIFASYYHDGQVFSCSLGFDTNNIEMPVTGVTCGEDLDDSAAVTPPDEPEVPSVDSTDATVALPTEMNGSCYVIRTIGQLQAIKNDFNGCYELGNDIDASGTSTWNGGLGFEPLYKFKGNIDGKGFIINNLTINRPTEIIIGFIEMNDGEVNNIKLVNATVLGKNYVGGLVGTNNGTVNNSYVKGNITGEQNVGALIGTNHGEINNSYSLADVTGVKFIGGLVGSNEGNIKNSYSFGTVTSTDIASRDGGLVGYNENEIINSYSISRLFTNTSASRRGGLTGYSDYVRGKETNSYYDKEATLQSDTGKGIGKTTNEMKQQSTYTGWDFTNIWAINPAINDGYPYLRNNQPY